ncbi:DMT family transporter [Herbaspirillum chlorophenolicum]|jgi:quaternary ammonium compound-resistance protein SugE|uniref:Guanidinium exporter n=1 Tax=Herbaspirillum chlorophenolicum TaxID=211589 RepID=A0ABW8EX93_9BURK|nr:multidrug efflux SMR transporter [Herbaspirillum chlorophenolicum]
MAWIYLFLAALCEIAMGTSLKMNEGWTRPLPSIAAIASGLMSIYLLALSLRTLPMGMAYAIWTGTGAVGLVLIGIVYFQETASPARLIFVSVTFIGLIGLRFSE